MRNPLQNWRDHPVQAGATTLFGMLGGPAASMLSRLAFGVYNRQQDAATANGVMSGTINRGNQAEAGAWSGLPDPTAGGNYTDPFGGTSPMTGFTPQWPGQGLPMAAMPWSSQPGVQGGWLAPGGLLDMLGQPQAPQTPDGTGVTAIPGTLGAAPGQFGGRGWEGVERGRGMNEMGIMGPGANGELFIRGVAPFGGNQRYFANRRRF